MSLFDDRSIIILGNGFVRTRFKTRDSAEPTYKYEDFPKSDKSDDSENPSEYSKKRGLGAYWYW